MVTKYGVYAWEFNGKGFADAVKQAVDTIGLEDLMAITGLSKSSILNWSNGKYHPDAPHPHLSNLLAVVNLLDLDIRDMFQLEEK